MSGERDRVTVLPSEPGFAVGSLWSMPPAVTHDLQMQAPIFEQVWAGDRPFDVRWDDRGYQAGQVVVFHELVRHRKTGRTIRARVGSVCATTPPRDKRPGFDGAGYVVLGLCDVERRDPATEPTLDLHPGPLTDADDAEGGAAPRAEGWRRVADSIRDGGVVL